MDELIEKYLSAVCSYFRSKKKKTIYNELKANIEESMDQYDSIEDLLIDYGHPRSLALQYGYRPFISHRFNPRIVNRIEKYLFIISSIYLFACSIFYLDQFNCLPLTQYREIATTHSWFLTHPIIIISLLSIISLITLSILDIRHSVPQEVDYHFDKKDLNKLPCSSLYPNHSGEMLYMFIFLLFFLLYGMFFTSDMIVQIQNESYQMIHLMTNFFQPYIMIIIMDFFIDMTKHIYTRNYIRYSTIINTFTFVALTIFVVNSHFLDDYLLPFNYSFGYNLVNFFILGALILIYIFSFYKLLRNTKTYFSSFRK
ncbi:MAG: hypothetical protein LUG12_03340 [Erysipelotrichaceae bacterium]|nr:hypothetical protein [Erysipelotrichaceae bacterium]